MPVAGDVLQRRPERLAVGRGHQHAGQTLAAAQRDVGQHVAVDVAVVVDLGFGEDRETHVTQRLDPGADDVGAAGCDVGEDGGLGLHRDLRVEPADRSAVRASSQRPSASKRGRCAAVGRPPRIDPSPMSRLGASHTRSTRCGVGLAPRRFRRRGTSGPSACSCVFGHAHGRLTQSSSVTALPAWRALPSYLVIGRCTEMGRLLARLGRGAAGVRRRRPRRSARRSPRGRWRRAAPRRAAAGRRSARRSSGCSSRRLWWRDLGHGSGKNTRTPVSDPGPTMCSSTSTPSPRTSRMLATPSRSIAPSSCARPRRYTSTATTSMSGLGLGHRQRRGAGSAADLAGPAGAWRPNQAAGVQRLGAAPRSGRRRRRSPAPSSATAGPTSPAGPRSASSGATGSW